VLGASTALAQPPTGPRGAIVPFTRFDGSRLAGELLAARIDSVWVQQDGATLAIPLLHIEQAQLQEKGLSRRAIPAWTLVGALATGSGMYAACHGVGDDCSVVFAAMAGSWALIGGLTAAMTPPQRKLQPVPEAMAPYARFPQGLPPQFRP
jgi:hypothetical protein